MVEVVVGVTGRSEVRGRFCILFYADKLLHFSVCGIVLRRGGRGADAAECDHYFYVCGANAECGESVAGGVLEDAVA